MRQPALASARLFFGSKVPLVKGLFISVTSLYNAYTSTKHHAMTINHAY